MYDRKFDGICRDCKKNQFLGEETIYRHSTRCLYCGGIVDPNEHGIEKRDKAKKVMKSRGSFPFI